jgi:hypothetical protein
MRTFLCIALLALAGCAAKEPLVPDPGAETVRVSTSHPGAGYFEIGPVSGLDGKGCGESGVRGRHDGAVASLMKNAFAMGGTHVLVLGIYEPRLMGECFVNTYRIAGTAYRQAKVAAAQQTAAAGDVVQQLRELQKLREGGVITQDEFERLKTKIISAP